MVRDFSHSSIVVFDHGGVKMYDAYWHVFCVFVTLKSFVFLVPFGFLLDVLSVLFVLLLLLLLASAYALTFIDVLAK